MASGDRKGLVAGMRLALYVAPLAALAVVGGLFYRNYTAKDRTIAEQKRIIGQLEQKLDRSWAQDLVADVRVKAVNRDAGGKPSIDMTFVQYQPGSDTPAFTRDMTLAGEELYIDALVVSFDRKLVEDGDGLRGKSMLLFRRAFGDQQKPIDGVPLWSSGDSPIPEAMQVDAQPTPFERELWAKFWTYANDPALASQNGIRVAQGEAPHVKAVAGQVYKVSLRAAGGLEITPRLPATVTGTPPDAGTPPGTPP